MRQERDVAVGDGARRRHRPRRGRGHHLRRPRPAEAFEGRAAASARAEAVDDLPGADDLAQSGAHHRPADRRGAARPHGSVAAGGAHPRHRDARPRAHPVGGVAFRRLSAPHVRRHAPARDDRDGACLRSDAADRRRADHRARRDDPGADPRSAARPAAALRHGDPDHHPRSRRDRRDRRRGGGDVRRQDRRERPGARPVRRSAASLYDRPARLDRAHGRRAASGLRPSRAWCRARTISRRAAASRRAVRSPTGAAMRSRRRCATSRRDIRWPAGRRRWNCLQELPHDDRLPNRSCG